MNCAVPAAQGYRMPAEWEPHAATWLAWPYNPVTWEGHLAGAEAAFVEIVAALLPHEAVNLLVPNDATRRRAASRLQAAGIASPRLRLKIVETGDIWIRDYGPIFVTAEGRRLGFTKWLYNAYGGKYSDLLIGNEASDRMGLEDFERFDTGLVLEGGSIDVNGSGALITTESCLLSPDRNPQLSRAAIEAALQNYLGVSHVLWLGAGIAGDDTTGHVDDLARFVGPAAVVAAVEEDPADENFAVLQENLRRLRSMRDERGRELTVLPLPMPRPYVLDGRRMAASYANFYIANGVVLVPAFGQPRDAAALEVLGRCFAGRRMVPIDCRELIWGYGSIHCATQQQPEK